MSRHQNIALRDVVHATIQMRLRLGAMVSHELRSLDHLENARWHVEQGVSVGMSGLKQQHPCLALRGEPGSRHASGRTTANHYVVKRLGHGLNSLVP